MVGDVNNLPVEKNGLYHSDCLVVLERLPSACVTLVYVDPPPYPPAPRNANESENAWQNQQDEYLLFLSKVATHLHRVLLPIGNLFFQVDPEMSGHIRLILDDIFGR